MIWLSRPCADPHSEHQFRWHFSFFCGLFKNNHPVIIGESSLYAYSSSFLTVFWFNLFMVGSLRVATWTLFSEFLQGGYSSWNHPVLILLSAIKSTQMASCMYMWWFVLYENIWLFMSSFAFRLPWPCFFIFNLIQIGKAWVLI